MRRETPNKALILGSICMAALVLPIDFSGVAIATAAIGRDLEGAPDALAWVVNAFMLAFGSTLLTMGALADAFGRRRIFLAGVGAFVALSLALCVVPNLAVLCVGRALQGIAAAATLAGGTAALAQEFEGPSRTRALSLLGTTFGAGLAFGPTIAGALVAVAGWRAIFATGAVIGLAAFLPARALLRETRDPQAAGVDWWGAASFTVSLAALTAAMLEAPAWGWGSPAVLELLGAAIVAAATFVAVERRMARPMLDLSLLRIPRFLGVQALPVATCFGYVVLLVLLPVRLIGMEGRGELESGLIMLALSLPMLVVPYLAARLSDRWSAGMLAAAGLLLAAAGLFWLARLPLNVPAGTLLAPLVAIGCGNAVPWGLMDGLSLSVVPPERAGMATGIFSTVRVAGEGLAIAASRALLAAATTSGIVDHAGTALMVEAVASGNAARGATTPAVIQAAGEAFAFLLYVLSALVVAAAAVIFLALRQPRRPALEACPS